MSLSFLLLLLSPALADEASDMDKEVDEFIGEQKVKEAPKAAPAANAFNPRLTAFGDMLWSVGLDDGEVHPASTPWLRSLEVDLRADVDPFAKAVGTLAIEQGDPLAVDTHGHGPGFEVVPEEVYVDLVALPAGLSARVGQFLLPLGVTNRMHPHDYPWPHAPVPFQAVIGDHGLSDVGAQLNYRVAHPLDGALTLQAAVVSGKHFDPDSEDAAPGWVGRAELFQTAGSVDLAVGGGATGLDEDWLGVADAMIRWRQTTYQSLVLLGEVFHQPSEDDHGHHAEDEVATTGWTTTLQLQPARSWYLGARYDQLGDEAWVGGTVSYYTSEFLRVRSAALTHDDAWRLDAQLTFIWGAHPVEPYWVNR
jgi:hypothetical protein